MTSTLDGTNVNDSNEIQQHHSVIPSSLALLCGAVAGTSVDVCLYPIDTLKTRLQSANGFWKSGGFRGIYKGVSAAFMGSAPGASLFFVTYETMKPLIHSFTNSNNLGIENNSLAHMLAAGFGEIAACTVRVPTEVVKQRMQTGQYKSFNEAIKTIYKNNRLLGFYVGYTTTIFREIPFSFIQFPLWEYFKTRWSNYSYNGNEIHPYQGALCGSVAGSIAAAVTTPLDVIKTRLMLNADKDGKAYNGFIDCSKRIFNEEGTLVEY